MWDQLTILLALILAVYGNFMVFLGELLFAALALFLSVLFVLLEDA